MRKKVNNRRENEEVMNRKIQTTHELESENKKCVQKDEMAYTYIIECADGSFYTGWTNHLEERIRNHNAGKGAKYTRSRLPVKLLHYEVFHTKKEAMKREYAIKQLRKKDKRLIIENQSCEVREYCKNLQKDNSHEERIPKILS